MKELFKDIRDDTSEYFKSGELIIIKNMDQLKAVLQVVSKVNQPVIGKSIFLEFHP